MNASAPASTSSSGRNSTTWCERPRSRDAERPRTVAGLPRGGAQRRGVKTVKAQTATEVNGELHANSWAATPSTSPPPTTRRCSSRRRRPRCSVPSCAVSAPYPRTTGHRSPSTPGDQPRLTRCLSRPRHVRRSRWPASGRSPSLSDCNPSCRADRQHLHGSRNPHRGSRDETAPDAVGVAVRRRRIRRHAHFRGDPSLRGGAPRHCSWGCRASSPWSCCWSSSLWPIPSGRATDG